MDLLEQVFESKNVKIFSTIIKDESGDEEIVPYFCGRDVCDILEYSNYRNVLADIEEGCKFTLRAVLGGGTTSKVKFDLKYNDLKATYINEEGLYRLMFHCKLPVAKKFQKWIFKEVLPTIRKTGKFELKNALKNKEDELSQAMEQLALKDKTQRKTC